MGSLQIPFDCPLNTQMIDPRLDSVKVGNYVSLEQAELNQIRLSIALSQVRINKYSLTKRKNANSVSGRLNTK